MAFCFIIPPHIFKHISKHGDQSQKEWAEHSLLVSEELRTKRYAIISGREEAALSVAKTFQKNRTIYTADNTTDLPGQKIRGEGEEPVNDPASDEAYFGTGATFDLYAAIYQRNSIDNRGMSLVSTVHYSKQYDNAFWDGKQMVYGDGDGDLFELFTKPIDVTAHELTHGVTQYSANLSYQDQPGALNESFSDVYGSLVKQQVLGQTAEKADWLIGEGIFTKKVHGVALRSMKAPGTAYDDPVIGRDPQPADMDHYVSTMDDNGGVHVNSGIPNHAFYLTAIAIGGNAWEKAGKIWYKALTEKLKANSDFAHCARMTMEAAKELFGEKEQKSVEDAWRQVGVI